MQADMKLEQVKSVKLIQINQPMNDEISTTKRNEQNNEIDERRKDVWAQKIKCIECDFHRTSSVINEMTNWDTEID